MIGHQRLADKLAVLDRLLTLRDDDVVLVPLQLTFIFGTVGQPARAAQQRPADPGSEVLP